MTQHDSPHPGVVLRKLMADHITVTALAEHLGVPRMALSRLLTGRVRMCASMALMLAEAFPSTTPERWMDLQIRHELGLARRQKRTPVTPVPDSKEANM